MSMWANHQKTRRRAQSGAEECHAAGDAARHHDMYARHRPAPWHRERQMRADAALLAYEGGRRDVDERFQRMLQRVADQRHASAHPTGHRTWCNYIQWCNYHAGVAAFGREYERLDTSGVCSCGACERDGVCSCSGDGCTHRVT